jgi:hypothetical protein
MNIDNGSVPNKAAPYGWIKNAGTNTIRVVRIAAAAHGWKVLLRNRTKPTAKITPPMNWLLTFNLKPAKSPKFDQGKLFPMPS